MNAAIWWIHRDHRLSNNQALAAALLHGGSVFLVFILDPNLTSSRYCGPKRLSFLFDGLRALDAILRERQNPYSPEAQVAQVIGLLDHFWIEKAILVGNSAGGTISMQTALAHPESITAQILVDPVVYSGGGTPDWMRPFLCTPQMRRVGPLIARQLQAAGEELIAMAWHDPSLLQTDVLEMDKKPVQVENWDKALWEFTNAGHVPHEERPAEFMKAVNQFLQEKSP